MSWRETTRLLKGKKIVIHADMRPANEHLRRYNGPSFSEVAALIPGNEDGMIRKRAILVSKRD